MAAPLSVITQWLKKTYPRPAVDPEWLEGCYSWIVEELQLDPSRDMKTILENVDTQLLESDFADSMRSGSGIPPNAIGADETMVIKGPILVEVVEIMEVGQSAYSLLQVHESRVEYQKQAQIRTASGDPEEHKPMPKFPRSMLQLRLSDGQHVITAVEHKSLPGIELGETPLGFKMVIKDVTVRKGIALLEPRCVEFKGHRTADRDERRDAVFVRSLKIRMGEDVPELEQPEAHIEPAQVEEPPADAPAPLRGRAAPRLTQSPRSPLRDISPTPDAKAGPSNSNAVPLNLDEHADDLGEPRRRKRPSRAGRSPSPDPPPREQRSRFFTRNGPSDSHSSATGLLSADGGRASPTSVSVTGPGSSDAMKEFARTIGLSPRRARPAPGSGSDTEEDESQAQNPASQRLSQGDKGKGKATAKEPVFGDASSDDYGFDFDVSGSFFEHIERVELDYLQNSQAQGESQNRTPTPSQFQPQPQTQVKGEPMSQAIGLAASTPSTTGSGSRGASSSMASQSAGGSKSKPTPARMDSVIDISDEEVELDKENKPVRTRHVRRRVFRVPTDATVIELSD